MERVDRLNGCSWQVSYEGKWQSKDRRDLCKTDYDREMDAQLEIMQKTQIESNAKQQLARDGLLSKISDITMHDSSGNLIYVRFHNPSNCSIDSVTISIFSEDTKTSRTYRATTFVEGLSDGNVLFKINKDRSYYTNNFTWTLDSIGIYDAPNIDCA